MNRKYEFPITKFTAVLYELNHLIDLGVHVQCSYSDMWTQMRQGTVIQYLHDKFSSEVVWGLSWVTENDGSNFLEYFNRSMITLTDVTDTKRKMGISNNGITLLIGFVTELIQQGEWTPNLNIAGLDD